MHRAGEAQRSAQTPAMPHTTEHSIASEKRDSLKKKKTSYPHDEAFAPPLRLTLRLSSRRKP